LHVDQIEAHRHQCVLFKIGKPRLKQARIGIAFTIRHSIGYCNKPNLFKIPSMLPNQDHQAIRDAIRDLCAQFPAEYFRKIDEQRGYPEEFVNTLTQAGWLAALIPEEYGGSGLSLTEASVIMEEINRSGGNS